MSSETFDSERFPHLPRLDDHFVGADRGLAGFWEFVESSVETLGSPRGLQVQHFNFALDFELLSDLLLPLFFIVEVVSERFDFAFLLRLFLFSVLDQLDE